MIGARNNMSYMRLKGHEHNHGFTLMEMLVALGLFSVIVVIAADLFFSFQRISRKTEALEGIITDARATIERITREAHEGTIDYAVYGQQNANLNLPQSRLFLRTSGNVEITFSSGTCDETGALAGICLRRGTSLPERLTAHSTNVRSLQFFVSPTEDPFAFVNAADDARVGQYRSDAQPRVTILVSFDNGVDLTDRNYTHYEVQTTVTSRAYRR